MRRIDTATYSAKEPHRVKPEKVDLGDLPPITKPAEKKPSSSAAKKLPRNRDTTTPRNHETMVSRYHDTIIELVRKAVKQFGKEAATHRFTLDEKKAIADVIYAYKGQSIRTSENEITRIAVNFIMEDYRENGANSILEQVLQALNE